MKSTNELLNRLEQIEIQNLGLTGILRYVRSLPEAKQLTFCIQNTQTALNMLLDRLGDHIDDKNDYFVLISFIVLIDAMEYLGGFVAANILRNLPENTYSAIFANNYLLSRRLND